MLRKFISLILAVFLIASAFSSCTQGQQGTQVTQAPTVTKKTDDTSFKLSYTQSDSLDPFKAKTQNNQVLATLVFESLFDLSESYEAHPNIATGYSFTDSKTLKVDINPRLTFSNSRNITVDDVVYSARAALKSPAYAGALGSIKSVSGEGNSVYFYLNYPNPYAVNLLTFPIASSDDDENGYPIGSGRYKYTEKEDKTVLTAVGKDGFDPYITTINLVNIAAEDSIDNAVNIGNISYSFKDMSADTSKRLSCAKKAVNMNNLVYAGVNSKSGITSNKYVRKAVSLALDRQTLADSAYSGYARPAESIFNPYFGGVENIKLFSVSSDIAMAKQAVTQSGYSEKQLSLTILVNNNENRMAAANLIKSQLELVGFRVNIDRENFSNYIKKITSGSFDIYIGEVKLSDDMNLYPFFDEANGGARYGINHKAFECDDRYSDYLDGKEELGEFIIAFNDETPYIPILYKKGLICYSKALQGDMQGYYGNFFSNIESWNFNS